MSVVALRPVAESRLSDSLPRLQSLVSPYTGIVRQAVEFLHAPDECRLVSIGASLATGQPVSAELADARTGGTHLRGEAALAAAIAEGVERYSSAFVPEHELVISSASDLDTQPVDPGRFALFHARQYGASGFPFVPFTAATRVRWTAGFSLPDCEPVMLPAQLTYLRRAPDDEALIGYATSNGVACGATLEEAILAALCEVIERDAFMLAWYNRLSLPRLTWSGTSTLGQLERRFFAPSGLQYSAVDLSVFFDVPAVLGVVHGPRGEPGALGVGAACATRIEVAWRKALGEAFSVRRWARTLAVAEPSRRPSRSEEIGTFDDHILFYADEERARAAAFLDGSERTRDAADVPAVARADVLASITALCLRLRERGASAYAVDLTSPDVLEAGLRVARVTAPELCPLDVFDTARFLGGERMYRAAHEAGLVPRPLGFDDLNPYPHPFP